MSPRPAYQPLTRPVHPVRHKPLTTVGQACDYMLALPKAVQLRNEWQHAARLCMAARESPSARAIAALTEQLELALMLSFRLDLAADKKPPAPSVRRDAPAGGRHRSSRRA